MVNSPVITRSQQHKKVTLDGSTKYITLSNINPASISVFAWVKTTESSFEPVIAKRTNFYK